MLNDFEINGLTEITKTKLINYNLINKNEQIKLLPNYSVRLKNKTYSHYIVICLSSSKRYFLKIFKDRDNIFECNDYIKNKLDKYGAPIFSTILVPKFKFDGMDYYITNYVEGESLDNIESTLSKEQCQKIGRDIKNLWFELTNIHTLKYSEKGQFFDEDAATIFKSKLKERLSHPALNYISNIVLEKAYHTCCNLINACNFSKPSLIHMDIKPANIVYNSETDLVTLIDFEHARFGDIDFGWTQIILSGYNSFGSIYENEIYPYIIEGHLCLSEAIKLPKYKCYIFYQTACNIIYYFNNKLDCPLRMKNIFYELLNEFTEERQI